MKNLEKGKIGRKNIRKRQKFPSKSILLLTNNPIVINTLQKFYRYFNQMVHLVGF
jgi:hypothetical protein